MEVTPPGNRLFHPRRARSGEAGANLPPRVIVMEGAAVHASPVGLRNRPRSEGPSVRRKGNDRTLRRGRWSMAGLVRIERTTGRLEGGCSIH